MKQKRKKFSLRSRFKSVKPALAGLFDMLIYEHNAWVHAAITVMVLALAWWLQIGPVSFALIVVVIMAVWAAEAFNTVLELVVDIVSTERYSAMAERAKDIAAAGVLIASAGASAVGFIILGPPLFERLRPFLPF